MASANINEFVISFLAWELVFCKVFTSGVEPAASWRIDRGRDVAFQKASLLFLFGVWDRHCVKKGFGVRVERICEEFFAWSKLDYFAKIHDRHSC